MPALTNRQKHEEELAILLLGVFDDFRARYQQSLRVDGMEESIAGALILGLSTAHSEAAAQLADAENFPLSDKLLSENSVNWGRARAAELANQIVGTTKKALEEANPPETVFSRQRAEMISVGEVTRATTAGELMTLLLLFQSTGQEYEVIWYTHPELTVSGPCPICKPLHGTERAHWIMVVPAGPPAHPVCVCELRYQRIFNA